MLHQTTTQNFKIIPTSSFNSRYQKHHISFAHTFHKIFNWLAHDSFFFFFCCWHVPFSHSAVFLFFLPYILFGKLCHSNPVSQAVFFPETSSEITMPLIKPRTLCYAPYIYFFPYTISYLC